MMAHLYPQVIESTRLSRFVSGGAVLEKVGPQCRYQRHAGLNINARSERQMSLIPNTPGICPAQSPEDPLIVNARFLNEAADLERRLAMRKAMRPARSAAARLGWERRK